MFNLSIESSNCENSSLLKLLFLNDLIKETILGFFSMYSTISGASFFLESPAKSLSKFKSAFKIKDNFELAELFYDIHIYSNYLIIGLITLHIMAVVIHKFFFNDNLLKKIL